MFIDKPDLEAAGIERKMLASKRGMAEKRSRALRAVRDFFADNDFLEVNTPVRIETPALEDYIEAIPSGGAWLRTSPEFHMKRLLAAGYERIWQMGPCFRKDEEGRRHRLEFTMLEWYRANADWLVVLSDTEKMLFQVALAVNGNPKCTFCGYDIDTSLPWEKITVEEAFRRFAGVELDEAIQAGRFEELLVEKVEPHLGVNGRPTALVEYPLACSGLSRRIPGSKDRVERWEVYVAGLELGNACSELADAEEQALRFRDCALLRQREGRIVNDLDQPFLDAMRVGMPPDAGVAIGMDRLFMMLMGASSIQEVNLF